MRILRVRAGGFRAFAFTPDGSFLITGHADGHLRLWDVRTGAERFAVESDAPRGQPNTWDWRAVQALAVSPDGERLAAVDYQRVSLWRLGTSEGGTGFTPGWVDPPTPEARSLPGIRQVLNLGFGPDGKTLVTVSGGGAQAWSVPDRKQLRSLAERGHLWCAGLSPDGRLLALGRWQQFELIDYSPDTGVFGRPRVLEHPSHVSCLAFAPDGASLATGAARSLRVWDLATGRCRVRATASRQMLLSVAYTPDGRTVATAGNDREVTLWDADSGREKARLGFDVGRVTRIAFSPDGTVGAAGGDTRRMVLWDVTD